jgi:hypothetical protein
MLGYHKFYARRVQKMLMGVHKMQRMASAVYTADDEFLNHTVEAAGDGTWVSCVNVETKEHSKQWMHTYSPCKRKDNYLYLVCFTCVNDNL